jgi:hypothetical protein
MTREEYVNLHGCEPHDEGYWTGGVDISRWAGKVHLSRGADYRVTGAPVSSGTVGVVRKFSTGRKFRGDAAADYNKSAGRA